MNDSKISVRYARALFQSALEKKVLENVFHDMIFVSKICVLPEVKELLSSPIIPPSKKNKILLALLTGNVEKLTVSMISMIVSNGRESFIPAIARVFMHDTMKYNGITESVLTTAVKVDINIKNQISEFMSGILGTKIELKENIDSGIIGGFILKIDDKYIDASIRNKLRKIEKELKGRMLSA
jgi:F-type H+-transporting ATPase subunit delta